VAFVSRKSAPLTAEKRSNDRGDSEDGAEETFEARMVSAEWLGEQVSTLTKQFGALLETGDVGNDREDGDKNAE
jgi:hypothetical protein